MVSVAGEVRFPGTYTIRQGETLSSLLDRVGGLTDFAYPQGSVFTRAELRERELEQLEILANRVESELVGLSLSAQASEQEITTARGLLSQLREAQATGRLVIRLEGLVAGDMSQDIVLQGGDQLLVPEIQQEVTVIGEVQYATSHRFVTGLERGDYIDRSGGLTRRADRKRIYVVRANGEVIADSGGRWFSRGREVEILPGDTIVAPVELDRIGPLALWTNVTQIIYNLAIAAAAIQSF